MVTPISTVRAVRALLAALDSHPRTRLIVIGGAASLEVKPGLVFTESGDLINSALEQLGLPREYLSAMRGHGDALTAYRTSNRLWTYFSPAVEIAPGERTGRFRIGSDQQPVLDADGRSRISVEDAAVALIDEVELPRFVQRRFTIGY
jgi:putative NADH-flavin reductase